MFSNLFYRLAFCTVNLLCRDVLSGMYCQVHLLLQAVTGVPGVSLSVKGK